MTPGSFGITVSCYRGDIPLLKGCLASIRENLPGIPICLITHGSFPTEALRDLYGVAVIGEAEVDPRLRARSYGYGLTKMIAFWHSPFERFLHIDADAVCWGNFLGELAWDQYDLVYNEPHEIITPQIQKTQYFDPDLVFPALPEFQWEGQPYFNAGVFIARRGIFDIDEYLDLLAFSQSKRGAFFSEQGILNFMAFRHIADGRIKARSWPLQAIVPVISLGELDRRFRFETGQPVIRADDRRVIHWAGPKPRLTRAATFPAPMVFYRLQHLRRAGSLRRYLGRIGLFLEDVECRVTARHQGSYVAAAIAKARWLFTRAKGRLAK